MDMLGRATFGHIISERKGGRADAAKNKNERASDAIEQEMRRNEQNSGAIEVR